jgi:hypothetical protein
VNGERPRPSDNDYDWLGPGVYFWEANPDRAIEFAREVALRKRNAKARVAVVGAAIDLGLCFDLTTSAGVQFLKGAYESLVELFEFQRTPLPQNLEDGRRKLDCAVVRRFHRIRVENDLPQVDTVRGLFVEGAPLYKGAGFHEKTHTQIVVCNTECIKGFFRVPGFDFGKV